MVIGVLIATAISFLFGYIAQAIFNWFNGVYDVMFWNAFAIEINFRGLSNFSISGLYNAVYTFAIAILIMSNFSLLDIFENAILNNVPNIIGKANVQNISDLFLKRVLNVYFKL